VSARKSALLLALRVVLGGLFVWAAATKLPDMPLFAEEMANYRLLPAPLVPWLAAALPGIEILAGLLLAAGAWTRASALVIDGMLLAFIAGLSQALLRRIDLRCGCFGGSDEATWATVARDVAMLAAGLPPLVWGGGAFSLEAWWRRRRGSAS
jgi:uncharacterized membrane protein YphA (DoxX/SURF4 family)